MKWTFSLEIKVRHRDIDAMQHVNNSVYFTYLEQTRTEYFMKLTNGKKVSDLGFIIASAKCDYKSAITIEDRPVVYVKPVAVGNTSWKFKYEIRDKNSDRLMAEAETVQVLYDYEKNEKKTLDGILRKKLLRDMKK